MIDTAEIEKFTCKVLNENLEHCGTAFFVESNMVLTSLHVLNGISLDGIWIESSSISRRKATLKDQCIENDLALLDVEGISVQGFLKICSESPLIGRKWAAFGHPSTANGLAVGSKVNGSFHHIITEKIEHDIVLNVEAGVALLQQHKGFSGSAVINVQQELVGVLRYKDNNNLCAVSIYKSEEFLKRNGVQVVADCLNDFSSYKPFHTIADPLKSLGKAYSKVVGGKISPQTITEGRKGHLIFPEKRGTIKELITYIKNSSALNNELWSTWLEFLSYVEMLKGTYTDINAIYITIKQADVSQLVPEIDTEIKQDFKLSLRFFFTEEEDYFSIAKQYLTDKSAASALEHNHCHIFHSAIPKFGLQFFTKEEKKKIIPNIASAPDAGLNIVGSIDYGVLSFAQLTQHVANSKCIMEVSNNLTKIFTDAIS